MFTDQLYTVKPFHFPPPTPSKGGGYRKTLKHMKTHQRSAFDARFVEVCHPRSQKLDDIRQMVPHLQFNVATDWGESDGIRWVQKSRRSKVIGICYTFAFISSHFAPFCRFGSILGMTASLDTLAGLTRRSTWRTRPIRRRRDAVCPA